MPPISLKVDQFSFWRLGCDCILKFSIAFQVPAHFIIMHSWKLSDYPATLYFQSSGREDKHQYAGHLNANACILILL